jgi:hypothetical protein
MFVRDETSGRLLYRENPEPFAGGAEIPKTREPADGGPVQDRMARAEANARDVYLEELVARLGIPMISHRHAVEPRVSAALGGVYERLVGALGALGDLTGKRLSRIEAEAEIIKMGLQNKQATHSEVVAKQAHVRTASHLETPSIQDELAETQDELTEMGVRHQRKIQAEAEANRAGADVRGMASLEKARETLKPTPKVVQLSGEEPKALIEPFVGSVWLHVESETYYTVTGFCLLESNWSRAVLYVRSDGSSELPIARAILQFMDGRFVPLTVGFYG